MSAPTQLSKIPSVEMSSEEDISEDNPDINSEPRRSGRVNRSTHNAALQASQDRAAALAAAKSLKGKKVRKAKFMNTSQLMEEFSLHQDK
jgi:hypothetical protein